MIISYKWLNDYVKSNLTPTEIDDTLTFSGLEIEGVEKVETIKGGLEHVVIGKVVTCEDHPDSDHLHVTTVDVGGERLLDIVCGAANVAAGQKVVVATIGTQIWTSETEYFEIKKSKIRGKVSEGMICAEDELGLGNSHDGIMVLPEDAPIGMPAKEYFNVEEDFAIEVAITANRADATSHIGVGRDLVAAYNTQKGGNLVLDIPSVEGYKQDNSDRKIEVRVEDAENCPRYSGVTITGVKVTESPDWLKNKLRTVGIRPINNIVDITNFVLMEVGQPMHAFDADMIEGGNVVVKKLPEGTMFTTLDGVERKLNGTELMICNEKEGMCIAGVFGGIKSGVTESTTNVFLESAYFNPVSVRKTSKLHGLKTDASFRYERGCDPNITIYALKRAAMLIKELAGGTISSEIIDVYPTSIERAKVDLNYQSMFDLIGKEIPVETIKSILGMLDITIESETAEGMVLRIPTNKVDVTRQCDVVEEIMRIYGYNNISFDETLNSCLSYSKKPNPNKIQNVVGDYLANNGFVEIMNNSLTKAEYYEDNADFDSKNNVVLLNPLSKELNVMRQTLLYSGLECIVYNINHKIPNQKIFEFGKHYRYNPEQAENGDVTKRYFEERHLSIFMTGNEIGENWKMPSMQVDFYFLKAHVINILRRLRINMGRITFEPSTAKYFTAGLDLMFKDSKKVIASLGRLAKPTLKKMDCKQDVYYADINWDLLLKSIPSQEVTFAEIAKNPEVRRDLALVLDKNVTFDAIEKLAYETEKKLLKKVSLFDVYEGDRIEEGKKSYAVSFILQDKEKTLSDKQIEAIMAKLQKNFETRLEAKIRS
ncbi:MAG: phenylalanine--tRNA ligase subunit beta [Bacteroidales bacterium]|nr:phenylalanine--tRNA ligase subunit beta [Bacteroidales bacterium]